MDCYDTKACVGKCDECEIFKEEFKNDIKISLINKLHGKIIDYECEGNSCLLVACPIDQEVKEVLGKLGVTKEWIEENTEDKFGLETINLTLIGFEFAEWWDSSDGFSQPKED